MCGLFGGRELSAAQIEAGLAALAHRGPDACRAVTVGPWQLGHTRLSILDLDARSDQPFRFGQTTIAYNGELWNHQEVRTELEAQGLAFTTTGDTEVVAAALDRWGERALPRLNGMFAVAWVREGEHTLRLARDRYGEIPLHFVIRPGAVAFASERKALRAAGLGVHLVLDVPPGGVLRAPEHGPLVQGQWYTPPITPAPLLREEAARRLHALVVTGSSERAISDVPVCALLSGGIDSAAITLALRRVIPRLVTYTAVMNPNSPDLKAARLIAAHLDLPLVEVPIPVPSAQDLARVVGHIEMPHKAQVEIAWACLHLARRMREDGFKVTFSGEGSDELWASYGFAYHALKTRNWHAYRRDLFLTQARKNFARCNKVFMAYGVECRLPFLHPPLVEFALSLPQHAVQDGKGRPKAVLQEAFASDLPARVTRRPKLAFQDGLGLKSHAASAVAEPRRFYQAEYERQYGSQARGAS